MPFAPGEPAPWFKAPTPSNPEYHFDTAAGRYVLLLFLPTEAAARSAALAQLLGHQAMFDDQRLAAFVVVRDPRSLPRIADMPGLRWFLDADGQVSRLYGALGADGREAPFWLALDPTLRVLWQAPIEAAQPLFTALHNLPPPGEHAGGQVPAPILVLPRVFEPELCARLVALHETSESAFSGVMRT